MLEVGFNLQAASCDCKPKYPMLIQKLVRMTLDTSRKNFFRFRSRCSAQFPRPHISLKPSPGGIVETAIVQRPFLFGV